MSPNIQPGTWSIGVFVAVVSHPTPAPAGMFPRTEAREPSCAVSTRQRESIAAR